MATQIAPTPTVRGTEAARILKEANKKTSDKAIKGSKNLKEKYVKLVRK